ncbi:MAG: hypothetical protein RML72_02880 [Bacteroidia bacterium]|nr:hypothetical protein [Bacteroidia bacterium]MDW8157805.1 hypothetical protein [Bacteroidia bacterium]
MIISKLRILYYWLQLIALLLILSAENSKLCATEPELKVLHLGYEGEVLIIRYSIPYDGMVEIKILNHEKKIIWRNQFNKTKGEYGIRIPRKELEGAKIYEITYKGRVKRGKI